MDLSTWNELRTHYINNWNHKFPECSENQKLTKYVQDECDKLGIHRGKSLWNYSKDDARTHKYKDLKCWKHNDGINIRYSYVGGVLNPVFKYRNLDKFNDSKDSL